MAFAAYYPFLSPLFLLQPCPTLTPTPTSLLVLLEAFSRQQNIFIELEIKQARICLETPRYY